MLVLDEPTAVLSPTEAEGLFAVLRRLRSSGLSIVFISHKLREVVALADRVAVLRAGRKVADRPLADADAASLAALMVGRDVTPSIRQPQAAGEPVLVLDRARVAGEPGRPGLVEASLVVRAGEIVGIAGVSGNGQAMLAGLVAGTHPLTAGEARVGAERLGEGARSAVRPGIARIPEDRHREGVVPGFTVAENLALEALQSPAVRRFGFLRFPAMRARAVAAIRDFDIRGAAPETPVRLLSGGNMQKVVLARVLEGEPRLILADQPTRGLDIGASGDVHRRLLAARERGAAVLLISEDLDELLALSDRLAVMAEGRLSPAEPVETLSRERIGLAMAGHGKAAGAALDKAA